MTIARLFAWLTGLLVLAGCAGVSRELDAERLAVELARRPVVLLGEVHDNVAQHRARALALAHLLEAGVRPAIAFEQFDRERQPDIERARREPLPAGRSRSDHVIEQARTAKDQWNWDLYRPFVALAIRYDLPIVAANLSRTQAMRVAREGAPAVLGDSEARMLQLVSADAALLIRHESIVNDAHCRLLPSAALGGLARAQLARDAVLASALRPYFDQGVVLLTGNGHARRDIGIPRHLTEVERARVWSIGLLEHDTADDGTFDVALVGPAQPRPDPCAQLRPASVRPAS